MSYRVVSHPRELFTRESSLYFSVVLFNASSDLAPELCWKKCPTNPFNEQKKPRPILYHTQRGWLVPGHFYTAGVCWWNIIKTCESTFLVLQHRLSSYWSESYCLWFTDWSSDPQLGLHTRSVIVLLDIIVNTLNIIVTTIFVFA